MAVEDLTTWTETDPSGRLTVASSSITVTDLYRGDTGTWVRKDFGSGYWSGDFEFRFEVTTPDSSDHDNQAWATPIMLANSLETLYEIEQGGTEADDAIGVGFYYAGGSSVRMFLFYVADGSRTTNHNTDLSWNTKYYLTLIRDDDGGANSTGKLTLYTCTGNYYGESGASLVCTYTLDLPSGEQNDYQYVILCSAYGYAGSYPSDNTSFLFENLDLDLDSGSTEERAFTIEGEGSLDFTPEIEVETEMEISGTGSLDFAPSVGNAFNIGNLFPTILTVKTPGWDANCNTQGAGLWNMTVPRIVDSLLGEGGSVSGEPSSVRQKAFNGNEGVYHHWDPWYEAAHLLPRIIQDVGNVITEQTIQCELYNADRSSSVTISSITDNLGDGFQVIGVPSTPFSISSQEGLSFQIKVLQSGELTFDSTYTLTSSEGDEWTVHIVGSRIVLIPIRPEAPLREHLIFDTTVIEKIDASEQRIKNRDAPRGMFEMEFKEGRKRLELLLFDRQSKVLAVPAWHEPSFLSSAVTTGDLTINVDTTAYGNFFVGGYAVILKDEYTYDALEIESMTSTSITFTSSVANDYDENTEVMPLMTAYAEPTVPMAKAVMNAQTIKVDMHIAATTNDIADTSGWSTYNGKVFLDDPNLVNGELAEALRTKVFVLDNISGDYSHFAIWDHSQRNSGKGFKSSDRAALWKLRKLLHHLKGQQVSFYIPTFSKDLEPNTTLLTGSSTFNMDHIGYTLNAYQRWPKQVFRLVLKNGTKLTRTIQNSSEVSSEEEQLTVDTPWPYDIAPEDIERCEFIEQVRLASDDIVITHFNALGEAECIAPTKEVAD